MTREPRYTLYGIDDRTEPFRLPDPYPDPTSLIGAIESLRIPYVVLSSKAAPWRDMEGAEPPVVEGNDRFYDWLRENAELRRRFVTSSPVPPIDMGAGRTFHSPVIEVYELSREGGDRGVEGTPGTRERA